MNDFILIFTPLKFYSYKDEDALFEWLNKLKCIKSYKGIVKELHIFIEPDKVDKIEIRDFQALFIRYKFENPEQINDLQKLMKTFEK